MMCTRVGVLALVLLATLTSGSCRIFRRSAKQPPAAPAPKPAATMPAPKPPPAAEPSKEAEVVPPPELPPGQPQLTQQPPIEMPKPRPPFEPRRRARAAPRPAPEPAEAAAEPPKPAAPAPGPQLQQILTPDQQRECIEAIDQSLAQAHRTLAIFSSRRPTRDQATSLARIRTFIRQAEEARRTDLLTARALAERAGVLAQDLLKSIQ